MTNTAWTPGPWRLVYGDPFDHGEDGEANGFTIEMAEADGARRQAIHFMRYAEDIFPEDKGREEAEANARLVTAAPDLYEACEAQHRALDYLMAVCIEKIEGFLPSKSAAWSAVEKGFHVMQKARGERLGDEN